MLDRHDSLRDFGERLRRRRRSLGLSQQQVADRLQLASADSVSRYERGAADPRLSAIVRFATALECRPAALLPVERVENPAGGGKLVEEGSSLLAALAENDLPRFARSLERAQAVGWKQVEIDAQGDAVRKTLEFARDCDAHGAAMSSWGPATAVFVDDAHALKPRADAFLNSLPNGGVCLVTKANNVGARITVDDTP